VEIFICIREPGRDQGPWRTTTRGRKRSPRVVAQALATAFDATSTGRLLLITFDPAKSKMVSRESIEQSGDTDLHVLQPVVLLGFPSWLISIVDR
jgi:hypothetical protein